MINRKLYYIRHGIRADARNPKWAEADTNPWDPPLSPNGRLQAEDIAACLPENGIEAVFSSPFLRALETAHVIAEQHDLTVLREEGLIEWLNPVWNRNIPASWLPLSQARELFPRIDPDYTSLPPVMYPEVEETIEVRARCRILLHHLISKQLPGNLVFVTHGAPLGQCLSLLLGPRNDLDLRMGAITAVRQQGQQFELLKSGCDHLRIEDTFSYII